MTLRPHLAVGLPFRGAQPKYLTLKPLKVKLLLRYLVAPYETTQKLKQQLIMIIQHLAFDPHG
jgi:hypothetical protein